MYILGDSTGIVSEDKDKATVKLTTTYVDITAIHKKALEEAQNESSAMDLTNQTEFNNKVIELYKNKLLEGLKAAQASIETKEANFKCQKQDFTVDGKNKDVWFPVDTETFVANITKMATNQQ